VGRLGAVRALRVSGGLAATGLGAALLIGGPIAGIVGFGLVGAGIANIIPVLFSSTGHSGGGAASSALAAVATPGYLGFLAGPPPIGLAAEHLGLRGALGLVCVACALVAVGARKLPPISLDPSSAANDSRISRTIRESRRALLPSQCRGR